MNENSAKNTPIKRKFFLNSLGLLTTPTLATVGHLSDHLEAGVLAGSVMAGVSLLANAKSNSALFNSYAKGAATGAVLSVLGVVAANSIDIELSDKATSEISVPVIDM